ncbi:MAG TPA: hypothetical protein PKN04_03470 [bacterium]|mgnify:CR=1 FL=1|jgi:hypothetical protein|nr:hypothetical protein [bacterium]HNT64815.1 hypothetical protein [bacterium]HOX85017.1 hypothetical protein [bacterium]HPG44117.1 hypothetical protein [bacterium]HPM96483.1 hypothetical protein [bacterium]
MQINKSVFAALVIAVLLGCEEQSTEPRRELPAPFLIASPDDMSPAERGIDAVAENNGIQLQWVQDDRFVQILFYRRAMDEKDFIGLASAAVEDTIYIDTNVELNKRYFYFATGLDAQNHIGPPSDTLDYQLVAKATNLRYLEEPNLFYWQLTDYLPDRYILKLYDDETNQPVWFSQVQSSYSGLEEQVKYNWDGQSALAQLQRQRRYRWRIDIVGPSIRSGSESDWQRFTLP